MGKVYIRKNSYNQPIPELARFMAFDETDFNMYFEELEDAERHAKCNECAVVDMDSDEIVIDTRNPEK